MCTCARAVVQMHPTSDLRKSISWLVSKHTQNAIGRNLNAIGPAVVELPRVGCPRHPLTRHVSRAVVGTGGYRCRSNMRFIEWWRWTKKTARESDNPFQRYKLLKSVTWSGWVGFGCAAHTEICSLNHRRTRSAFRDRSHEVLLFDTNAKNRQSNRDCWNR